MADMYALDVLLFIICPLMELMFTVPSGELFDTSL